MSNQNSPTRQMQDYQQYKQQHHHQQQQQQQQQPPFSPQQQHLQSLAVWSPSVPAHAPSGPSSPSPPSSSGSLNISGPLDLRTHGPHPILPPVKNALPPPSRPGTSSRATSLRRQLSQNGIRQQSSSSSLNQSYSSNPDNSAYHPPMPDHHSQQQQQQQQYQQQDSLNYSSTHSSASTSPMPSPYLRTPSSVQGGPNNNNGGNNGGSANLNDYFETRTQHQQDSSSSLLSASSSSPSSPGGGSGGLQRSNSKVNYSSPLLRSHSRSGSPSSPSSPALSPSHSPAPSSGPLKRQASILKNGSKDAPYLSSGRGNGYLGVNQESLNHAWEPSPPSSFVAPSAAAGTNPASGVASPSSSGPPSALSHYGSASNLRAMATNAAASAAASSAAAANSASAKSTESQEQGSSSAGSAAHEGLGPVGVQVSPENESLQPTQSHQELLDRETIHVPNSDSQNYKVPVPPSPIVSPRMAPSAAPNNFNFLNSDPTLQRSASRSRRMAPPIQVGAGGQPPLPQSAMSPTSMTSPTSPGRRLPRWENLMPSQGQGHGQDHHEDGDYEDEGLNDDTDGGDALSGTEDQIERRRRRQRSGSDTPFTPTRSAPPPPNLNGGGIPNSRQAEIAHIMYIQQQQALFLQEKAMNPPLRTKGSNGNLSGGNSDSAKPSKKGSRHRKQISVISVPKLVSSTNQVKTVPIVRPADQSDNEDTGARSEYTSGGEGIKNTVRRMRKAVRRAADGVFHDDDSDREDAVGSKSDAEKKGGLKQLRALKSKLAKKLHRPSHGGSSRHDQNETSEQGGEDGSRGPVQFFSEDNLRARYLQQEQMGGNSLAAAGAALRRSNTTRDTGSGAPMSMYRRRGGNGDKEEYEAVEEGNDEDVDQTQETEEDAAKKARMAKFGSRTFDKDEMMEVKDGTGESFFVPRWDFDPRADELGSSKSVISVQSSKKLDRSPSTSTVTSNNATKPAASIAGRLQGATVEENEAEEKKDTSTETKDVKDTQEGSLSPISISPVVNKNTEDVDEDPSSPKKLTWGDSILESAVKPSESEEQQTTTENADEQSEPGNSTSNSSTSASARASVISEASSNVSSVGGVVVAQVLTRQSSMKRNFRRPDKDEKTIPEEKAMPEEPIAQERPQQLAAHFGLGISLPAPAIEHKEKVEVPMSTVQPGSPIFDKKLPPIPQEALEDSVDSSSNKPYSPMTIRPLSPIRRNTTNSGRSDSIASLSSTLSTPTTPPATAPLSVSPLEVQLSQEASAKTNLERKVSQSRASLRTLPLGSFTLPKAPTSPLPSPSLGASPAPIATSLTPQGSGATPPTTSHPFPAILARSGSNLAERASIRSMYADSIYDCYDYDSASEYESQIDGNHLASLSRQGSFNTPATSSATETAFNTAEITTALDNMAAAVVSTSAASMPSESGVAKESIALFVTEAPQQQQDTSVVIAQEDQAPIIRPRQPAEPKEEETEEHHVLYEDLPKAVPYRMSMMTTVAVESTGATLTPPGAMPSRPPRHPMRQSRHGSMMSLGGSSDLTLDSWRSSSKRDTRDDLSGWGDADEERDSMDQDRESIITTDRRPSFSSSLLSRGRSERTMSMMTDKSHQRIAESEHEDNDNDAVRRGSVDSGSIIAGPKSTARSLNQKHWHNNNQSTSQERTQRETWGSMQSSSSDDATSSSSSRSSQFYFNGRSPSPSPTEESAPASKPF
ncbi:hypothetical protein BGZ83_001793 [Gryganskiella cystojenkinii]|nr:hypothetical protein BGZ83_001793 [Gryganskiella cystojenkinii]